ncbi:glycosyltransferase family 2 protein [Flavobacterium sp. TSSA_36]|uniref:glycosyltransferase family 2 protein n=1 Tax=Flavobacterium sp. TSSA_36 TaxID=3447669 RepID=UPI003F36B732
MLPFISVILPVYNASKFLTESIKSMLEQTFTNFELIIINDGSTDNSQSIIESFDDKRIRVFQKPNTGLIDSLNLAVAHSRGSWIARMDADDISAPNRLEEQIKFIDSGVAVIGTQVTLIDENGKPYGKTKLATNPEEILANLKKHISNVVHPSVLINKTLLLKVGGYDPKMHVAEDYDLWLRISKIGKIININQSLLSLRKHGDNISSNKLSISVENCLISLAYYFKSKSSEIMSIDEYTLLKRSVSVTAKNYFNNIVEWENKKIRINSFSPFFKMIFLIGHPNFLYQYWLINSSKKSILNKLKKNNK